jgi:hypothetical protein
VLKEVSYPNNTIDSIVRAGIIYKRIRIEWKRSLSNIIGYSILYRAKVGYYRLK